MARRHKQVSDVGNDGHSSARNRRRRLLGFPNPRQAMRVAPVVKRRELRRLYALRDLRQTFYPCEADRRCPGLDQRTAPSRGDQTDRNVQLFVQMAVEVIQNGREGRNAPGATLPPVRVHVAVRIDAPVLRVCSA